LKIINIISINLLKKPWQQRKKSLGMKNETMFFIKYHCQNFFQILFTTGILILYFF
jgi:hypothetical protein